MHTHHHTKHEHKHKHGHNHHTHHHHHHHHHHGSSSVKNLGIAFALNFAFTIIEFIGGFYTGSVAILSDALHDLGDSIAIGMAIAMEKFAKKSATPSFSYGYRRWSLVSAALTGIILVSGTVFLLITAIPRLLNPVQPRVDGMIVLALFGVVVNGVAALRVSKGKTLNERAVSWHLLEDVLGWVVILIGSIVMSIWDLPIIDPILSIIFSVFILFGVVKNLRQVFDLFLQGVPKSLDLNQLHTKIKAIAGVQNLHDVHVWSLDGESHVMTMHAVVDEEMSITEATQVKGAIRNIVNEFGSIHLTLEIERLNEHCPDLHCGSSQAK